MYRFIFLEFRTDFRLTLDFRHGQKAGDARTHKRAQSRRGIDGIGEYIDM
jgi:hypothetical protein